MQISVPPWAPGSNWKAYIIFLHTQLGTDVLKEFRERVDKAGYGYQTMINEALKEYLAKSGHPLNEEIVRRVVREELNRADQQ